LHVTTRLAGGGIVDGQALRYTRYNSLVRLVMRQISKKEGGDTDTSRDYEYTDWGAVDRFAVEFLSEVEGNRPVEAPSGARASAPQARA
jgi:menaquinone-dependent protoporphyrinogen oxidase